ncbi:MAG TPA: hypothetical protein VF770_02625, partial [Solirubrobacterales bacterium]
MKLQRGDEAGRAMGRPEGPRRLASLALLVAAAASALTLAFASGAAAATITIGSPLPLEFSEHTFEHVDTMFNTALPERGVNVSSPVSGTIVRWRIQGANGGPYYLRVLRPNGSG